MADKYYDQFLSSFVLIPSIRSKSQNKANMPITKRIQSVLIPSIWSKSQNIPLTTLWDFDILIVLIPSIRSKSQNPEDGLKEGRDYES